MSKKNTLVSILMPVYNCIDTLEKTLDCAIKQTYKNTEILISDNDIDPNNFQKIYGHVRPNTYDINSKSISEKGNDFVDFLLENPCL